MTDQTPAPPPVIDPVERRAILQQKNPNPKDGPALMTLVELANRLGFVYGSDDISMLLYTLIRREQPRNILELGTGLGVSCYWMAQAVKENGAGRVWTVDDGSDWTDRDHLHRAVAMITDLPALARVNPRPADYGSFVTDVLEALALRDQVGFLNEPLQLTAPAEFMERGYPFMKQPIELLFADIANGPDQILDLLFLFSPHLAEAASIFIDSASTSQTGYLFLEQLIDQLNAGKVPRRFMAAQPPQRRRALMDFVALRRFTLVHLTERKTRRQNATAWIKVEPIDHRPHPLTQMRD